MDYGWNDLGNRHWCYRWTDGDLSYWVADDDRTPPTTTTILHRMDGPARTWLDANIQEWWYQGVRVGVDTQEDFERWLELRAFI